jgi:hypothetical protein
MAHPSRRAGRNRPSAQVPTEVGALQSPWNRGAWLILQGDRMTNVFRNYIYAALAVVTSSSPCNCAHRLASVRFETLSLR